jgi:hypothetical protein
MAASLWQSTGKRENEKKRGKRKNEYFCGTNELRIEEHTQNAGYVRAWSMIYTLSKKFPAGSVYHSF